MAKNATGGVTPWQQIDALLVRFAEDKKKLRAEVRKRFGTAAAQSVRTRGSWWQCRFRKRLRRAMTPERLLELLDEQVGARRE
jgi:hypothetical protein